MRALSRSAASARQIRRTGLKAFDHTNEVEIGRKTLLCQCSLVGPYDGRLLRTSAVCREDRVVSADSTIGVALMKATFRSKSSNVDSVVVCEVQVVVMIDGFMYSLLQFIPIELGRPSAIASWTKPTRPTVIMTLTSSCSLSYFSGLCLSWSLRSNTS